MNKKRREKLYALNLKLDELCDAVREILEEEEQAYANLPESIQNSLKGEDMANNIDNLQESVDEIESAVDKIGPIATEW